MIRGGSSIFLFFYFNKGTYVMTQTPFTLPITENMAEDTHKAKNPPLEAWGKAGSAESGEKMFTFSQSESAPKKQANPKTTPDMANLTN